MLVLVTIIPLETRSAPVTLRHALRKQALPKSNFVLYFKSNLLILRAVKMLANELLTGFKKFAGVGRVLFKER